MFESGSVHGSSAAGSPAGSPAGSAASSSPAGSAASLAGGVVLSSGELAGWLGRLAGLDDAVGDAERVDQLRLLEELKSAAAAAQARVTAAFAASQRAAQAAAGVPARRVGSGVAAQVALARRDSPVRGGRHLGLAQALVAEMPHTLAALTTGVISEWRATIVVRETGCLSAADRAAVDAALAGRLGTLGDRQTEREARKLAYRLDPGSVLARVKGAEADRRVSIRPAPDTMALVTGLLPVAQGVAVHAALTRTADSLRAGGDARSRGQIMADEFVARLTGQATATAVPVEIQLVMTDTALLGGDHEPAHLHGHGPIPAALARRILTDTTATSWLRRLYTDPADGTLVAMDSRSRCFPATMKRFLINRDQICRTPWCNAPIRHSDHVEAAADGGATSLPNGQGLCEACNHTKQAPGWTTHHTHEPHTIEVHTPTGHTYPSRPPPQPGTGHSHLEDTLRRLINAA